MIEIKNERAFENNVKVLKKKAEAEKEMAKMNGTYTEVDERLEEVFGDKDFMKDVLCCENPDKAYELFCTRNSDLTKEQFVELIKASFQMYEALVSKDEELSEDELEQIAGGGFFGTAWKVLRSVGCTIATPFAFAIDTVGTVLSLVSDYGTIWGYKWTTKVAGGIVSPWKE